MKENPEYAYKYYVLCPVCNQPLMGSSSTGKSGKRFPAYHCGRNHKRFSVANKTFDEPIKNFINAIEFSDDFIAKLTETLREEWAKREREFNSKAIDVNTQILAIDKEIEQNLVDFKAASSPTVKAFLERDIEKLNSSRLLLADNRNEKEHEKLNKEKLLNYVKYYMEHFPELLLGSKNPLDNASFFGLVFEERPTYYQLVDGTPNLSSLFKLNAAYKKSKTHLVTPTNFVSNTSSRGFTN